MNFALMCWLVFKSLTLIGGMFVGILVALFGVSLSFVLGLEAHPSSIMRFGWLCWGSVLLGLTIFIFAGSYLAQLIIG